MTIEKNTEEKILEAAKHIFQTKGFAGARMAEIADEAGINKALLHYYYRSKEELYKEILTDAIKKFQPTLMKIMASELPIEKKLVHFVDKYYELITQNPNLPLFFLNELNQNPASVPVFFTKKTKLEFSALEQSIRKEIESGKISDIKLIQFIANMLSLTIFPFIAKPIISHILRLSDSDYDTFLAERKELLPQMILSTMIKFPFPKDGENDE